ncbi:MAG: ACT domain-containing protein [Bacillaceae bacterium]|nr:ACT domain-containing protein [Bacillaceae bacterium]
MSKNDEKFYLIRSDILPEAILKTVQAKKLVESGEARTVNQAVERVGLSRSAYYKYKDGIFPFNAATRQQIVTISMILEHRSGVLSQVLSFVALEGGNILTINQTIPLQGMANVVISVDTVSLKPSTTDFLEHLGQLDGVRHAMIVGQE